MKSKIISVVPVSVIIIFSLLISVQFTPLIRLLVFEWDLYHFVTSNALFYISLLLCMLIVLRPYLKILNVFKIFGAVLIMALYDTYSPIIIDNMEIGLAVQIFRVVLLVGLLILTFLFVTRIRPKFDSFYIIIGLLLILLSALESIKQYIFAKINDSYIEYGIFHLSSFLSDTLQSKRYYIYLYTLIFLSFMLMVKTIPTDAYGVKLFKRKREEEPEEYEETVEIPEGHWRCMGCGEMIPDDLDECQCGYKRKYNYNKSSAQKE